MPSLPQLAPITDLLPPSVRTFRQFAEQEVTVPDGPLAGTKYDPTFMPFTALILDAFTEHRFRRYFGAGSVQSGKTFTFFMLPLLYHLFEMREDVIVGVPKVDMAHGIWNTRIKPIIDKIPDFAEQMPSTGSGSRGGKFKSAQFKHGPTLRFMGAGGDDADRSSFPARVVILTEIDKMDTAGKASRETDPVSQIEARTTSFGDQAMIYGECTVSIPEGRIWQEVTVKGSDGRVVIPCPHCGKYHFPERKNLHGWEEAKNEIVARELAHYTCPDCERNWSEDDRRNALRSPRIVHKGQSIERDGDIVGSTPATLTCGVRWNAMHSGLLTLADIAEKEWVSRNGQHTDSEAPERELTQFVWTTPYEPEIEDLSALTDSSVRDKAVFLPKGTLPVGTEAITVGIDVGKRACHWVAIAWYENGKGHVLAYGVIEVPEFENSISAIRGALHDFREDTLEKGFQDVKPKQVLIDSGGADRLRNKPFSEAVYPFCSESGLQVYKPAKGFAQTVYHVPTEVGEKVKAIGPQCHIAYLKKQRTLLVEINVDHWKTQVHDGFRIPSTNPGSYTLFQAEKRTTHLSFAKHICAERLEEEFSKQYGRRLVWRQLNRNNHWLDATALAACAAGLIGITITPAKREEAKAVTPAPAVKQSMRPQRRQGLRRMRRW